MDNSKKFTQIVSEINTSTLKVRGFRKKLNTYMLSTGTSTGFINFQRSVSNTGQKCTFTVNLGVSLHTICSFFGKSTDDVWEAHWRERLGQLMPFHRDYWWIIDDKTDWVVLADELREAITQYGFPELDKYMQESNLYGLWQSGKSHGITEYQRLLFKAIMEKSWGQQEVMMQTIAEMSQLPNGKSHTAATDVHIEKLMLP
jgi:hypothetical protein